MKQTTITLALTTIAFAGITPSVSAESTTDFENARRPTSNPTLFDLALPTTNLHPIYAHHGLPDRVSLAGGGTLPLGGDLDVYAIQFEFALNERLSIVATKDGYVDINDTTFNALGFDSGFANLGAGLKYAFILDPASSTVVSGTATFELPTGNSDVFQGQGDGAVNLIVSGLKLIDEWQFAGAVGTQIPFSDEQATNIFMSAHASYDLCDWFIPLVEINWFHVVNSGNGGNLFSSVSNLVSFEGNDFFNIGAANAGENRDLITAAIGFRSRITDQVQAGIAYEFPLTDDQESLWDDRVTVDIVWTL
jgi:hypothetical protein